MQALQEKELYPDKCKKKKTNCTLTHLSADGWSNEEEEVCFIDGNHFTEE